MPTCSQCSTPAFVQYEAGLLCVDHHLKHQQAAWYSFACAASVANHLSDEIAQGMGNILPPNYIIIPKPPSMGDKLTLNHIDIKGSNVGMVNTGVIKHVSNLDASITVFKAAGQNELGESLRQFTQLLWSSELAPSTKEEVAEQVALLAGQVQAEPLQRSRGIFKSVLRGVKETIGTAGTLAQAWYRLQQLLEQAFQ